MKDYTIEHFKAGDTVSAKNRFPWLVYPASMTVTRIRRNKYGRVSYVVSPGIVNWESGRKHDWLLLEEIEV